LASLRKIMTEIVQGLFGVSPEQLQMQQDQALQARAMQYAQMSPQEQATSAIYTGVSKLGGSLGGMLGGVDPVQQQASKIASVLQGADQTTSTGMMELYRKFSEAGMTQQAQMAVTKAQELKKAEAEAGLTAAKTEAERALATQRNREKASADPFQQFLRTQGDKVTPESLAIYQQTGKVGDLVWITKANKTEIQQLQDYRDSLPINSSQRAEVNEVIKGMGKGKGTTVQNILPGQGAPNVSDVTSFVSQANTVLKPFKTAFESASEALSLLETGNPKAGAQVDRLLAKAAGDSQLSQAEVTAVASAGSFPQRVADSVSKFFTGGVGSLSTEQKKEVLTVFQTAAKDGFNNERQRLSDIYGTSRLSPEQVKAGLGEPLKVNTPKATASPMKFDADKEKRYLEWKAKQTAQPK
jgi:hypothetical protein